MSPPLSALLNRLAKATGMKHRPVEMIRATGFPRSPLAGLMSSVAIAGILLACGSTSDGITPPDSSPPIPPPLESVPYSLLGSGKVAFERVSPQATYVIDASALTSVSAFSTPVATLAGLFLVFGPAISPDGKQLAFTRYTDAATRHDVYVSNIDGTSQQRVTQFSGQEGPPSWSPDGTRIVVAGNVGGSALFNIYSQPASVNAGDVRQLTDFKPGPGGALVCPYMFLNDVRIAVSPQGALALECSAGEIDVLSQSGALTASYVASRADRRRWPAAFSPSWSPDGSRLAFVEIATDSATNYSMVAFAVKVMDANATNVTTIVNLPLSNARTAGGGWLGLNNWSLCWTRDGSRLVFNVPESNLVGHIWVVRADGTGLGQLTSAPGVWDRSVSCSR